MDSSGTAAKEKTMLLISRDPLPSTARYPSYEAMTAADSGIRVEKGARQNA